MHQIIVCTGREYEASFSGLWKHSKTRMRRFDPQSRGFSRETSFSVYTERFAAQSGFTDKYLVRIDVHSLILINTKRVFYVRGNNWVCVQADNKPHDPNRPSAVFVHISSSLFIFLLNTPAHPSWTRTVNYLAFIYQTKWDQDVKSPSAEESGAARDTEEAFT